MKMTTAERLAVMETAHAAQRVYRRVLDEAHADIGQAIQDMPEGTTFTARELASAAGVCYQALYYHHTSDHRALKTGQRTETKKFAAILPDGSVDFGQTIKVTRNVTTYTRTDKEPSTWRNMMPNIICGYTADPDGILNFLASIQPEEK